MLDFCVLVKKSNKMVMLLAKAGGGDCRPSECANGPSMLNDFEEFNVSYSTIDSDVPRVFATMAQDTSSHWPRERKVRSFTISKRPSEV